MTSSRLWRSTTPALSTDRVVAAAIDLLDASGLESLSMRRLGDQLGAPATTLYSYVGNKDELLDLVLDAVIGTI
ncbi:TetR/AcrR family transcriptional regulator, partial [Kibdelosporangium lantanae]